MCTLPGKRSTSASSIQNAIIVCAAVSEVARHILTSAGLRTRGAQGNQIHSSTLWTLGIQKMYMGTLGYKCPILTLEVKSR